MDDDLLAEVKAEAEAAARAEMERMDADRRARESAEAARRADVEAARKSEIGALVEAERARQQAVNEHRLQMFTPVPSAPPPAAAPAPFAAAPPPPAQVVPPHIPARGAAFYVNVVALPLLCLTAIVLTLVHNQRPIQPAPLPVVRVAAPVLEVADAPYALKPQFAQEVKPVAHVPLPKAKRPKVKRPRVKADRAHLPVARKRRLTSCGSRPAGPVSSELCPDDNWASRAVDPCEHEKTKTCRFSGFKR